MPYLYAENRNFEDFASGRVFYALPGQPAFPARLASEIFQRALRHWRMAGGEGGVQLYDPVCGGAYWLTVLAYLHWNEIAAISASDFDDEVLPQAERNLSLMTPAGLDRRITELEEMRNQFGKESHATALESARRFHQQLRQNLKSHAIRPYVFQADATDPQSIQRGLGQRQVDLVLADVPYGWHSAWITEARERGRPVIASMLEALHPSLTSGAVVAVAADKSQKIQSAKFHRLERFQIGKRRIFILRPQ